MRNLRVFAGVTATEFIDFLVKQLADTLVTGRLFGKP